jgi:mono/diheme cytochrome c family protein
MRTMMSLVGTMICLASAMGHAQTRVPPAADATVQSMLQKGPLNHVGEGRRTFLALNCYGCHGMYAGGAIAPNIVGAEQHDVNEAVMQGREGGMPSFRNYVKTRDIKNLTAYLQSIGGKKEPMFKDWWVDVPPK